jgi:hypothetical protein
MQLFFLQKNNNNSTLKMPHILFTRIFLRVGQLVTCSPVFLTPQGQGSPDVSWYNIQNGENVPKRPTNIPNEHKTFKMALKYVKIFLCKAF